MDFQNLHALFECVSIYRDLYVESFALVSYRSSSESCRNSKKGGKRCSGNVALHMESRYLESKTCLLYLDERDLYECIEREKYS